MKYDVVVPVAEKDLGRASLCLSSLKFLNPKPDGIYVVNKNGCEVKFDVPDNINVFFLKDDDVLRVNRVGFSPNWTFQQTLKLFQEETKNEWYLCVDSDVVFLRDFPVFENDKPLLWFLKYAYFENFDKMMRKAFGFDRHLKQSMVCHVMMFNKTLTKELLDRFLVFYPSTKYFDPRRWFYDWMVENQTLQDSLGESEVYPNYVTLFHHDLYNIKQMYGCDTPTNVILNPSDVEKLIKDLNLRGRRFDMVAIHTRLKQRT